MEAQGIGNRGAEVEAGQVSETVTAPAPQGAVALAPGASEWMEIPVEQFVEQARRLRSGEAIEMEVEHYGVVARYLIVADDVRVGREGRPVGVFFVFVWAKRAGHLRVWAPFVFKRKVGGTVEKGVWAFSSAWSEDQLANLASWLAGNRKAIRARRYVIYV